MGRVYKSQVIKDEYTDKISKVFDYDFDGTSMFKSWDKPNIDFNYSIGLIVGTSGSGKSTLLREFGNSENHVWDNTKSIASNFDNPDEAISKLGAVGLGSIPTWVKPYNVLSNGERFRADLARSLKDGAIVDEFSSVVDRQVAKACSVSISKYIRNSGMSGITLASCHYDIIDWLEPDWVFYTDTGMFEDRRFLRCRPEINLEIYETKYTSWELFKKHHYLTEELNKSCRCFVALWEGNPVAFSASISLPSRIPPLFDGDTRGKFRESRLVVLPDYQGMGIGTKLSNTIGEHFLDSGYRYFSKTAHVRMGEYRQKSNLWRPTSTNLKDRAKSQKCSKKEAWHHMMLDTKRLCYSHEYIGQLDNKYRILYENQKLKNQTLDNCVKIC